MTVGEWLALLAASPSSAWEELYTTLGKVAAGARGRTDGRRSLSEEDLEAQQECVALLIADVSPLRRAKPGASLDAFLWGYLRNVLRRLRNRESSPRMYALRPELPSDPRRGGSTLADLTDKQAEAVRLLRQGMGIAQIARELGISWTSARDRLMRAHRRINLRNHENEQLSQLRDWVVPAFRDRLRAGDRVGADIIFYHVQELSHAAIGERVGLSRDAVRKRLQRVRRRNTSASEGSSSNA
jgi:DNA-directed RNA polymerase specialized sigma24 family protein